MILIVTIVVGALAIAGELLYARLRRARLYCLGDTFTNFSAAAFEHVFTVLVAVPLLGAVMVPIKMLYVEDVVGDEVTLPGESAA